MTHLEMMLTSGVTVSLRPRTYPEWEAQEDQRLRGLEAIPELVEGGKIQAVEIALQRLNRTMRAARLETWVKDFSTVKEKLSLRDVAEIEKAALELEDAEIPLGNSANGGSGQ